MGLCTARHNAANDTDTVKENDMGALVNEQTMTQKDMVLRYMRENGSITQAEAASELGCFRLGARIFDLKQDGHSIRSVSESHKNRWGHTVHYARYFLEVNENGV